MSILVRDKIKVYHVNFFNFNDFYDNDVLLKPARFLFGSSNFYKSYYLIDDPSYKSFDLIIEHHNFTKPCKIPYSDIRCPFNLLLFTNGFYLRHVSCDKCCHNSYCYSQVLKYNSESNDLPF